MVHLASLILSDYKMLDHSFPDLNVVITGASRGLGKATAIALTQCGANVALLGRNSFALEEMASRLPKEQVIGVFAVDLGQPKQIAAAYHGLVQEIAHIDLLINNAAGWMIGPLEQLSDEEIAHVISSTVTGSILMTKHLLPLLKKGTKPHIINIISTAGMPNYEIDTSIASVPYFAAKWGQAGFSEALRDDVKHSGIKVSTIYPGSFASSSTLEDSPETVAEQFGTEVLGVKDVVETILFCAARPNVHSITIKA